MKVLFVTNWYPTRREPYKAVWVREQAKAAALFNEIVVLHSSSLDFSESGVCGIEAEKDESIAEGVPTWRVCAGNSLLPKAHYVRFFWSVLSGCVSLARGGFRPDLIHVHVYDAAAPAVLFAKFNRIPLVVSEHFSSFPRGTLSRFDRFKARVAFGAARVVVTPSRFLQSAIEGYGFRARFEVIPNAVDPSLFFPRANRNHRGDKRILSVAQQMPTRGIACLLHAFRKLRCKRRDWQADIVGDGPLRVSNEKLAADLDLTDMVTFHGSRSRKEVARLTREADLFVLPSLMETFSVPVAEALTSGVPVLSTRCGGPEELIASDSGKLVPPGDSDALFDGLDLMLNGLYRYTPELISASARERFSPQVIGARLDSLYQSVMSQTG